MNRKGSRRVLGREQRERERICPRPSTRRPSFKSKTNPGPATGRRACAVHRTDRDERASAVRITRKFSPPAATARQRFSSPPSRRSATLSDAPGVLRARKTSRAFFTYVRDRCGGEARLKNRRARFNEARATRGTDRRFSREIPRCFSLSPDIFITESAWSLQAPTIPCRGRLFADARESVAVHDDVRDWRIPSTYTHFVMIKILAAKEVR